MYLIGTAKHSRFLPTVLILLKIRSIFLISQYFKLRYYNRCSDYPRLIPVRLSRTRFIHLVCTINNVKDKISVAEFLSRQPFLVFQELELEPECDFSYFLLVIHFLPRPPQPLTCLLRYHTFVKNIPLLQLLFHGCTMIFLITCLFISSLNIPILFERACSNDCDFVHEYESRYMKKKDRSPQRLNGHRYGYGWSAWNVCHLSSI